MIEESYVSFEVAKLLKEKGFDEFCRAVYIIRDERLVHCTRHNIFDFTNNERIKEVGDGDTVILAPTLQMTMKWLREVHNQIIVPGISLDDRTSSTITHYITGIWYIPQNNGGAFCYTSPTPYGGYPSYEEACEAAIRYCLENLI